MTEPKTEIFNKAASSYDAAFTFSEVGKLQRKRVYYWLNKVGFFKSPKQVFEVNCGTGYDAKRFTELGHKVIASDGSDKMVEVSRKRNPSLNIYKRGFEEIAIDENIQKSDAVFSNFGGLNCLSEKELRKFINDTAVKQNKGDLLIVVIMASQCFMADLYHLLKGKPGQMGRRNRNAFLEVNVNGEAVKTYYHHPKTVAHLMHNNYKIRLRKPVACFLPPSYTDPFFKRNKRLLKGLYFLEYIFGNLSFLSATADHYIIIAEKK